MRMGKEYPPFWGCKKSEPEEALQSMRRMVGMLGGRKAIYDIIASGVQRVTNTPNLQVGDEVNPRRFLL